VPLDTTLADIANMTSVPEEQLLVAVIRCGRDNATAPNTSLYVYLPMSTAAARV